jgi:hypothetical protein
MKIVPGHSESQIQVLTVPVQFFDNSTQEDLEKLALAAPKLFSLSLMDAGKSIPG